MSEMSDAIRALSEEKGIDEESVKQTIENMIVAAYRASFGKDYDNCIVRIADDLSDVSVYARKTVVDGVYDPVIEIELEDAKRMVPEAELNDTLDIPLDPKKDFQRKSVSVGKQEAHRGLNETASNILMEEYKDKVGQIIIGYYQNESRGNIYVDLGKIEGVLPYKYQSPREVYEKGDRIRALIKEVRKTTSGVQIVLSRADPDFVKDILELEVPEIQDGSITVMGVAREAGYRTKIAVVSNRIDVDAVGSCVGIKGVRIQNVIREIEGEKIDIIRYNDDPHIYIAAALTPADVKQVAIKDTETREALVVVSDDSYSLAIGKQGMNVRLAGRLTNWQLDVKTEDEVTEDDLKETAVQRAAHNLFEGDYEDEEAAYAVPAAHGAAGAGADEGAGEEILLISELPGVDESVARRIKDAGYDDIEKFVVAYDDGTLFNIEGLTKDDIEKVYSIVEENVEFEEEEEAPQEEEEEYFCPECGARITPDMTKCPNCGAEFSFEEE